MGSMNQPFFLRNRDVRLMLFGGKGGVGKTTCAAATALYLSQRHTQDTFLLVSTDPAHSLADSLAGALLPVNLTVLELDAQSCLKTFIEEHRQKFHDIASRGTFLDAEDINRFLDLSLPGMDEVISFMEITRWVNDRSYNCIIVDTAPTGHTLRLLAMPALIKKWLEALDTLLAKHRYMKKLFSGTYRRDELDHFLEDMASSINQMEKLMKDHALCRFVPVMLAETLSICETQTLINNLQPIGMPVTDIIVNRIYPENDCPVCIDGRTRQTRELTCIRKQEPWRQYTTWLVPLYPNEVHGSMALEDFWQAVKPLDQSMLTSGGAPVELHGKVESESTPPSGQVTLIIFAGKGGVGKTTLACSTALRMAHDRPEGKILLFSTDPAHSLTDCLNKIIDCRPTAVVAGLDAMQIDAQEAFQDLKTEYQEELDQFLKSVLSNLDLAFDREVMERVMDLSPPGLDEIMALAKVMALTTEAAYDVVIIDSAPTGHLIRLLELPQVIDQWLKVFFNLFLKYKDIFRLPGISRRLVKMSKDLKRLRTLLADPVHSALYAVSILTEMSFQETQDLLAGCKRIGVHAPALFLNMATPEQACPFCAAVHRREARIKNLFSETFPDIGQTLVYRQGDLRGIDHLAEFGRTLYQGGGDQQKMGAIG